MNIIIGLFLIIVRNKNQLNDSNQQAAMILKRNSIPNNVPKLFGKKNILGDGFGCENERIFQGRSYFDNNINISDCFFSRTLTYTSDGGVIYVSGGSYSMNLNSSMFFNCSCTGKGGAVFFSSVSLSLKRICANQCQASSQCHFAYLRSSQNNIIDYLSISSCSKTNLGYYPIWVHYGNQRASYINSSMNRVKGTAGFIFELSSTLGLSYCTVSNNINTDGRCIWFHYVTGAVSFSNIIHNNSPDYGIVYVVGESLEMNYCIFHNNQNYLFVVDSGSLEVSHSFIDHSSSSFSSLASISTILNNSFTQRTTYQIHFFNSQYCNAEVQLSTPLSTIEQTHKNSLQPTLEMTPIDSPQLTPYRSYGEQSAHQTLLP